MIILFKTQSRCIFGLFSLLLMLFLSACGGGSSTNSANNTSSGNSEVMSPNVVAVSVDNQVFSSFNQPYVSVTLCSPSNPTNCLTIDHILVDTGSSGLRVFASPETTAALSTLNLTNPTPIGECLHFALGYAWGSVKLADLKIGGEIANNIAIQVISDPAAPYSSIPSGCSAYGTQINTPSDLGANGILGVGLMPQDCGTGCEDLSIPDIYYDCSTTPCNNVAMSIANQLQNPVTLFSTNNNGVILTLPPISSNGATNVVGTLTFGIGTQTNNTPKNTHTMLTDSFGFINITLNGQVYAGFIDSGSNGFFFNTPSNLTIAPCIPNSSNSFYCPSNSIPLTLTVSGSPGSTSDALINLNIANANSLYNSGATSINNIGGVAGDNLDGTFDLGLPFFFGRSVYIGIASNTAAPYYGW